MSKSLEARCRSEFYDVLRARWRELGLSEKAIASNIARQMNEAENLLRGRCPQCGSKINRYVDYQKQQGSHEIPGAWVQYRCSTQPPPGSLRPAGVCDFMVDLVEGEAAS